MRSALPHPPPQVILSAGRKPGVEESVSLIVHFQLNNRPRRERIHAFRLTAPTFTERINPFPTVPTSDPAGAIHESPVIFNFSFSIFNLKNPLPFQKKIELSIFCADFRKEALIFVGIGAKLALRKEKRCSPAGKRLAFRRNEGFRKGENDYEQQEQQPDQHPSGS